MNKAVVLDTSAIIAAYNDEPGGENVKKYRDSSYLSSVNLAEAIIVFGRIDVPPVRARAFVDMLVREIVVFDEEQAELTAALHKEAKKYGLSLGDCACLALAQNRKIAVVTADKVWDKLKKHFDIILLR